MRRISKIKAPSLHFCASSSNIVISRDMSQTGQARGVVPLGRAAGGALWAARGGELQRQRPPLAGLQARENTVPSMLHPILSTFDECNRVSCSHCRARFACVLRTMRIRS